SGEPRRFEKQIENTIKKIFKKCNPKVLPQKIGTEHVRIKYMLGQKKKISPEELHCNEEYRKINALKPYYSNIKCISEVTGMTVVNSVDATPLVKTRPTPKLHVLSASLEKSKEQKNSSILVTPSSPQELNSHLELEVSTHVQSPKKESHQDLESDKLSSQLPWPSECSFSTQQQLHQPQ
ncbi:MAG: hypothetical protein O7D30_09890, partial [Rickettsia endosymbiont of Ixodes persulcatus]|nr:hypothetical protein [Rickettsia endosymbiont of Ixodes persulcatus]